MECHANGMCRSCSESQSAAVQMCFETQILHLQRLFSLNASSVTCSAALHYCLLTQMSWLALNIAHFVFVFPKSQTTLVHFYADKYMQVWVFIEFQLLRSIDFFKFFIKILILIVILSLCLHALVLHRDLCLLLL